MIVKLFRFIALVLLLAPFAAFPQNTGNSGNEYDLKALFIFNFIKYVDWPQAIEAADFKVGVLGQYEILESLRKVSDQKKINNRKIEVEVFVDPDDINCQLLFIPRTMSDRLPECINKFSGKGVLIVTEGKNLATRGSSINFVMVENKMKFEINQNAVHKAGLKLSSQLLNLALVVK